MLIKVERQEMENHPTIQQELNELQIKLNAGVRSPWEVQPNYFNDFADEMVQNIKTLNFISDLPQSNPFEVPNGYFEQVQSLTQKQGIAEISSQRSRSMPFDLPVNYFEQFEVSLTLKIKEDNFLPNLPKSIPYQLPSSYFEQFEMKMNHQIAKETVVPRLRVKRFKWSTLALAASVILFVTIGFSLISLNSNTSHGNYLTSQHQTEKIDKALNDISTQEIEAYIKLHQSEFATDLSLESNENANVDLNLLEKEILDNQFKNLTLEELNTYL